ncbi:MAG: OmpA family protein [Myxococcota bacterium]
MRLSLLVLSLAACHPKNPILTNPAQLETNGRDVGVRTGLTQEQAVSALLENFARVHFATDTSTLDTVGKAALDENARILASHTDLRVEVQGHADERGTVDYNLALGQRRADAVVDFLVSRGVAPSRLPIVSYGEERPAVAGAGETAWAENRRAEFRVLTGSAAIRGTTTM